jgi:NitT/TauT family transport system substrate-binding protein
MRKIIGFGIIFLSLVGAAPSKASITQVQLALNWKPEAEFGGFYAAEAQGDYKKNGLHVDILPGGVGTPVVQMVAAGRAEFGISTADELVLSRARGSDVVGIFAVYQTNPQGLMTQGTRGAKSIADLLSSGTLAIQKGLPNYLFLEQQFGKIKAKVVPFLGGVSQVLSDKNLAQQCYVTSEPLEAKKKGVDTRVFLIAGIGFNPYSTLLITRRQYLKNNPKVVDAMIEAVRAGWTSYLQDPTEANAIMAKLNPTMDAETLKQSAEAQKPLILNQESQKIGLGGMTRERWRTVSEQLKSLKLVTQIDPPENYFYQPEKK